MLPILAEWRAGAARTRQEGIHALVAAVAAHMGEHRIEGAAGAIRSRHVARFHVKTVSGAARCAEEAGCVG